ncbi:MAG: PspC domain-containing protein [candidate division Zixibacteria bacterium]|nr:PspC domain-containing protein [candidate division Zixibacteria bacterium]
MPNRKLYRSRENAMLGGVCAGLAEYFNVDSSLIRLATVLLVFPGGLSFWVYVAAWIIIPQKPLPVDVSDSNALTPQTGDETVIDNNNEKKENDKTKFIVGIVLVVMGMFFLMNTLNIFVWFSFFKLWPIVLIIIGAVILVKALDKGGLNEKD